MTSKADTTFTLRSFGGNLLPSASPDVTINTVLKKQQGDATLSFQFNDASLRDPSTGVGMVLAAEKPLGEGVKGSVAYNLGSKDTLATVTFDNKLNGHDMSLKAAYQFKNDALTVQETWKFDKQNKLVGTYNFNKQEALFNYEHTRGNLKLGASYSLKAKKPILALEKKQGDDTFTAMYGIHDEAAMLTWQRKPFKAVIKGKAGKGGVSGVSASLMVMHEFVL